LTNYSPAAITIALIAVFMIMFEFFNMFVNAVFWYLFNDVVPAQFLARFMGAFRIVSTGASALYNCFIFKYANTHMREIFVGAALLYLVGFGVACIFIKEGQYPPLDEKRVEEGKGWRGIKTFFKESFMVKLYRLRFYVTAFSYAAWSIATFTVFFNRDMGLTLAQIGYISAIGSVAMMAAMYLMAIFVDRWHPLRITVYGAVFGVLGSAVSNVWLFVSMPGEYFFWLNIGNVLVGMFLAALVNVSAAPSQMRIFPRSRYGQFCSAQAMLRSVFTIIAGFAAGLFIDFIRYLFNGSDFAYRFIYLWMTFFLAIAAVMSILLYREWYRLGGDKNFHPPAPWTPGGYEELAVVPIVGPQTRWMNVGLRIFDTIMWLSVILIPVMMWWLYHKQAMSAFKWYGVLILPLAIMVLFCWLFLRRSICRDMAAARGGLPLRNGIPHHGMMIVLGSKFLLAIGIWVCQVVCCIVLNLQSGSVVFGIASVASNFLLITLLYVMCRVERGYSVTIDEPFETASAVAHAS
jgi:MFS family permease